MLSNCFNKLQCIVPGPVIYLGFHHSFLCHSLQVGFGQLCFVPVKGALVKENYEYLIAMNVLSPGMTFSVVCSVVI